MKKHTLKIESWVLYGKKYELSLVGMLKGDKQGGILTKG